MAVRGCGGGASSIESVLFLGAQAELGLKFLDVCWLAQGGTTIFAHWFNCNSQQWLCNAH